VGSTVDPTSPYLTHFLLDLTAHWARPVRLHRAQLGEQIIRNHTGPRTGFAITVAVIVIGVSGFGGRGAAAAIGLVGGGRGSVFDIGWASA